MGKVHRIKRAFWRVTSQNPLPFGRHRLGSRTGARLCIGNVIQDGRPFFMNDSRGNRYRPLMCQLIKQREAGVAHSDKSSVKD